MFRTDAQEVLLDFNLDSGGSRTRWERSENLRGPGRVMMGLSRLSERVLFAFFRQCYDEQISDYSSP